MILAAGRGERMRPLTDVCPKPLLKVKDKPLIEYHIDNLIRAGITDIVINHAWLGAQIVELLGNGERFGANIYYSEEPKALETAGGIMKALPLLAESENDPFIVINGDVYSDFDLRKMPVLASEYQAHLMLVDNPSHNLKGDFIIEQGVLCNLNDKSVQSYTFSGIALYRPSFFLKQSKLQVEPQFIQPLAPLLRAAADQHCVSASILKGKWTDVGTPERLAFLNQ